MRVDTLFRIASMTKAVTSVVGSDSRYDYTAVGPVVNVASRMCDDAGDGEILITRRVAAEAETGLVVESVGERSFKGVSRPVDVLRLIGLEGGAGHEVAEERLARG